MKTWKGGRAGRKTLGSAERTCPQALSEEPLRLPLLGRPVAAARAPAARVRCSGAAPRRSERAQQPSRGCLRA